MNRYLHSIMMAKTVYPATRSTATQDIKC